MKQSSDNIFTNSLADVMFLVLDLYWYIFKRQEWYKTLNINKAHKSSEISQKAFLKSGHLI
jgi:hypothetical protein